MRLVRFQRRPADEPRLGVETDGEIRELDGGAPATLEALLALGADDFARATRAGAPVEGEVRLLAPSTAPSKILALGLNYESHMREVGLTERPAEPTVFSKLNNSLTGPFDPILLPEVAPKRVDYEAELAVVIGRRGRSIDEAVALDHVAGYTVANDVSARDWQLKKPNGQWLLGKSFDTFLPLGPAVVTADELPDAGDLLLTCSVNGGILQSARTSELLFGIAEAIAYLSRVCTLEPGDLILTGTPAGVGMARDPRRFLQPGDVVECAVSGIGSIVNEVQAAGEVRDPALAGVTAEP